VVLCRSTAPTIPMIPLVTKRARGRDSRLRRGAHRAGEEIAEEAVLPVVWHLATLPFRLVLRAFIRAFDLAA